MGSRKFQKAIFLTKIYKKFFALMQLSHLVHQSNKDLSVNLSEKRLNVFQQQQF
jgi:hypothetical protein